MNNQATTISELSSVKGFPFHRTAAHIARNFIKYSLLLFVFLQASGCATTGLPMMPNENYKVVDKYDSGSPKEARLVKSTTAHKIDLSSGTRLGLKLYGDLNWLSPSQDIKIDGVTIPT